MTKQQFDQQVESCLNLPDEVAQKIFEDYQEQEHQIIARAFIRRGTTSYSSAWYGVPNVIDSDEIAPYFLEINGGLVRGIGVYRPKNETMCESPDYRV